MTGSGKRYAGPGGFRTSRSRRLTAAARDWATTSSGRGSGSGTACTLSAPRSRTTAACGHLPLAPPRRPAAGVSRAGRAPSEARGDPLRAPARPPGGSDHTQVLVDGQRGKEPPPLRHVADPRPGDPVGRSPDELLAFEADRARELGRPDAHDRVAECRLAHAVPADDCN